jgi:tetratricopeptide (TPR) repeat protein
VPTPLKLFYSYAHEDEELRDELKKHLTLLHREGVISEWHDRAIVPGQEWDEEIKTQLDEADIILLLVSPDFLASDYIHRVELTRALERHDRGEAVVIPVILRQCQWQRTPLAKLQALPKNARPIKRWKDRDEAFDDVAEGIRLAANALPSTRKTPPQPPTSAVIPRPPAVGFVSRRDEEGRDILARLKEELAPGRGQLIALWGPGGSGKSTLAAEVARALRPAFGDRLAWVSALGRDNFSLSTLLDDIATQLGHPEVRTAAPAAKEEQVRALVSASPALVVLDNFETIKPDEQAACAAFLASCGECPALITTRVIIDRDDTTNVRLAAMEPDEAREFLGRLVEKSPKPSAFAGLDRDELIRECEANPLVMQWVVGQIVKARRPQDVLDEIKSGEGDAAQRVFDRSFKLDILGDDGRDALLALSLFAPDASRAALAAAAGFGEDLRRLDKAVTNLSALWLVETTDGNERPLLRGLTRQLAASRLARDDRAPDFRRRFVAHFLAYAEAHRQKTAEDLIALEPEKDNLVLAQSVAFEGQDWSSVVRLRFAVDEFLDVRGYWGEAVETGEQALQAARSSEDESEVAGLAHNLAVIYQNRGELAEARRLYDQSLEINRRLGDQRGVATTLHQLAWMAQDKGDYDEARSLYSQSLEINKELGEQRLLALSLHNLGGLSRAEGALDEARRLYNESLNIKRGLGDQHGIALSLHAIANLLLDEGELEQARLTYEESLEITKKLGDKRILAMIFNNMGLLAEREGDSAQAIHLLEKALRMFEELGSPYAEMTRNHLLRIMGGSS